MPKLDGFQMCRPSTRSTYFDVIEIAEQSAYGQIAGERTSMPMLIPEIYELARCGHRPHISRERMTSTPIAVRMASSVRDQLSRKPNVSWPTSNTMVTRKGAR
jgi:hypothetical protein